MPTQIQRNMVRIPGRVIALSAASPQKVRMNSYYLSAHKVTVGEFSEYLKAEPRMKGQIGMDDWGRLGVLRRGEGNNLANAIDCPHDPQHFDRASAEARVLPEPVDLAPIPDVRHFYPKYYRDDQWPMVGVNAFHIAGFIDWETRQGWGNTRQGVLRLPYAVETANAARGTDGKSEYGTRRGTLRDEAGKPLAHFNPNVARLGRYTMPVGTYPGVLWPDGEVFDLAGNGYELQNGLFVGADELYGGEEILIGAKPQPGLRIWNMPRELRVGMFQQDENDPALRADYGVAANPYHADFYTGFRLAADVLP